MHIVHKIIVQLRSIILISFLLLITGCTVEYNVNISKNGISENITVLDSIGSMSVPEAKTKLNNLVEANMGNSGMLDSNYELKQIIDEENYGLNVYLDNINNYSLTFKNNCFEKFEINSVDDYYELKTSGKFKCLNVWNKKYDVDVKIHIEGTVLESNADQVNGNNLIWTISDEVGNNIYVKYNLEPPKTTNIPLIIFLVILAISIIVVIKYLIGRHNEANKI